MIRSVVILNMIAYRLVIPVPYIIKIERRFVSLTISMLQVYIGTIVIPMIQFVVKKFGDSIGLTILAQNRMIHFMLLVTIVVCSQLNTQNGTTRQLNIQPSPAIDIANRSCPVYYNMSLCEYSLVGEPSV